MKTVMSDDGTRIAYEELGDGPPVIMVAGAFNDRSATAPLGQALADRFTVISFDRRGRGDSGDGEEYDVDREIDDIAALISAASGASAVFGYSSGGNLALHAAASGLAISKLVLYEPPFRGPGDPPAVPSDLREQLSAMIAAGKRGAAVELYQTEAVHLPEHVVIQMRDSPFRPALEAIAHTLAYDAAVIGDLAIPEELHSLQTPALVICGEQTSPFMRAAAATLAGVLPDGTLCTLAGQSHGINPEATAPVVSAFLAG